MPEPPTAPAPVTAPVTGTAHQIVVNIGHDSSGAINFTFVHFAQHPCWNPCGFNPDPAEVINVLTVEEKEKEKLKHKRTCMTPVTVQIDIGREAANATNFTYTYPPPTAVLPSPGKDALQFAMDQHKAKSVNDGVADYVLAELGKMNQRLARMESSSSMTTEYTTFTLKRPREEVPKHADETSHSG